MTVHPAASGFPGIYEHTRLARCPEQVAQPAAAAHAVDGRICCLGGAVHVVVGAGSSIRHLR